MTSKLVKLPLPAGLKKVVIKDEKVSATQGGTFTSGAWRTRDLNKVEGDTDIVSLSSNQFTLPGGSYMIIARAPARNVDGHQARLYNVTTSSEAAAGTQGYAANSNGGSNNTSSIVSVKIDISSATTFEIQHQCQTTYTTSGFGTAGGSVALYTTVTILKL